MRFMMFMIPAVYQPGPDEAKEGYAPRAEEIQEMMKFNEELARAGALIALDGLHPKQEGARISFSTGKPVVTDGPFIETSEVVGGYWIIDVASKEEAISWAQKCPAAKGDTIEVRRIFEMEDFPPEIQNAPATEVVEEAIKKNKK